MFLCSYVLMFLCSYVLFWVLMFLCLHMFFSREVKPMWNRSELEVRPKWIRSETEEKSKDSKIPCRNLQISKWRTNSKTCTKNHQRWWYSRPSNSSLGPVCKKTICDVANPPPIFPHHPDPLMAHRIILSFCIPFVLIIEPGKFYWSSSSPGGPWEIGQW